MRQVTVYRARPEAVFKILGLLSEEGLDPVALDDPDATLRLYSAFTYLVRIAVPEDQADKARSVLAQWEEEIKPQVDKIGRKFTTRIIYALLVVAIIYGVLLLSKNWSAVDIVSIVLVLATIPLVLISVYKRWKKGSNVDLPPSDNGKDRQSDFS